MKYFSIPVLVLPVLLLTAPAEQHLARVTGQMHAPVWDSYLAGITLHNERAKLGFDLLYCKGGGVAEHTEHQMYILGYLEKDEARIFKLAADTKLTNKSGDGKLLLDVLKDEKLATVLTTKVAERKKEEKGGSWFPYSLEFENNSLYKSISGLKNFDATNINDHTSTTFFHDKYKLLAFVPVNDCKYATNVSEELRKTMDFAHFQDVKTILLYFKPLPYRFQFKLLKEEGLYLIYID